MSSFSPSSYIAQPELFFYAGRPIQPEHISTIVARYDAQKNLLHILSSEIRELDSDSRMALLLSEQYIGCRAMRFWSGTGVKHTPQWVHTFDLNRPDTQRVDPQREARRDNYLKSLKRTYGDNYKTIAPLMEHWDINSLRHSKHIKQAKEDMEIEKLQRQIKRLTRKLQANTTPTSTTKKPTKAVKPQKTKLPELDAYIERHRNGIRTDITKRVVDRATGIPTLYPRPKPSYLSFKDSPNPQADYAQAKAEYQKEYIAVNGPTYDPSKQGNATYGVYKQTVSLTTTSKPKRHYHLQAKCLKAEVPNYRDDIRFSHIQNTKIEFDKGTTSVRCAVFDWS